MVHVFFGATLVAAGFWQFYTALYHHTQSRPSADLSRSVRLHNLRWSGADLNKGLLFLVAGLVFLGISP